MPNAVPYDLENSKDSSEGLGFSVAWICLAHIHFAVMYLQEVLSPHQC